MKILETLFELAVIAAGLAVGTWLLATVAFTLNTIVHVAVGG